MSDLGWDAEDFVVGRVDAVVLNYALIRQLANEDMDEDFHAGELVEEEGVSRPALRASLRRLMERGWLDAWVESDVSARMEARPARTYYRLSSEGRHAVGVLLGSKGDGLLGSYCHRWG